MSLATTTAPPLQKPCTRCQAPTAYEPLLAAGVDLAARLPHYCPACHAHFEEQERQDARERIAARRTATWEKTIPAKYRDTSTTHPDFHTRLWETVKGQDILRQSIGFIGPAGRCKTRVLALLARRAIAADHPIGWCPATAFQWAAQREFDQEDGADARRWMRTWHESRILFLDDLGKHRWTEAVESAFFALIEARTSNNLPTHWSLNPLPGDDISPESLAADCSGILSRALDPAGKAARRPRFAPILSRLQDQTIIIPVP